MPITWTAIEQVRARRVRRSLWNVAEIHRKIRRNRLQQKNGKVKLLRPKKDQKPFGKGLKQLNDAPARASTYPKKCLPTGNLENVARILISTEKLFLSWRHRRKVSATSLPKLKLVKSKYIVIKLRWKQKQICWKSWVRIYNWGQKKVCSYLILKRFVWHN